MAEAKNLSSLLSLPGALNQPFPPTHTQVHYIKLIDMVTGRGHMDVNRISGYIPGKIVFFLMQVCLGCTCAKAFSIQYCGI